MKELKNIEKKKRNLILSTLQAILEEQTYDIITNNEFEDIVDLDRKIDEIYRQYWNTSDLIADFYGPRIEKEEEEEENEEDS